MFRGGLISNQCNLEGISNYSKWYINLTTFRSQKKILPAICLLSPSVLNSEVLSFTASSWLPVKLAGVPISSSASSPRNTRSSYSPIERTYASYSFRILLTLCSKCPVSSNPVSVSGSPLRTFWSKSSLIRRRHQCSRMAFTSLTIPSWRLQRASTTHGLLVLSAVNLP